MDPEFIINKWNYQDQVSLCGFSYREPILAQRVIMVQSAGLRAMRKIANVCKFGDSLQQMILNLIIECREEGYFNLGERYSATLHKMQLSHVMKAEALLEDAQLSWTRGEGEMAKRMIEAVISENKPTLVFRTYIMFDVCFIFMSFYLQFYTCKSSLDDGLVFGRFPA